VIMIMTSCEPGFTRHKRDVLLTFLYMQLAVVFIMKLLLTQMLFTEGFYKRTEIFYCVLNESGTILEEEGREITVTNSCANFSVLFQKLLKI